MPYRLYGGGTGLTSGLAFFISCNEVSNGSAQVNRADSSVNGRTFTDVNTTPSATAASGHPYVNQCLPALANSERLSRANEVGLQTGGGDGITVAAWVERTGVANVNGGITGLYNSANLPGSAWLIYWGTTTAVTGITVAGGAQLTTGNISNTLNKRALVIIQKPVGSSVLTLYYREYDAGAWSSTTSGANTMNAGTEPVTIGASAGAANYSDNVKVGPVMYWPSRLLTSNDRDVLFNNGDGLTYEEF